MPLRHRSVVWKILLGYVPLSIARREAFLAKKKTEYEEFVRRYLGIGVRRDEDIYHQVSIDVPRTCPEEALFRQNVVRECLIRILYCHSIRRPASGYVQGMNDLATPLFHAMLRDHFISGQIIISPDQLLQVEADVFWCLGKLLDAVQDNYTFNQAGLYRQINGLKTIIQRADRITISLY